ncbi:hypothetical protein AGMMS49944_13970 [Spirochaetia bacterium]|nr:hypothetical protein AGMMS49944_13970 [Spirochaetia bacterium]
MELTKECIDEIVLAARQVESGSLTITIQARPEDKRFFDMKLAYEKRYRVGRSNADTAKKR